MVCTPRPVVESVLRSVCGRSVEALRPLAGGGMNETYRVDLAGAAPVVVRIARQQQPWFVDEAELIRRAAAVGVPTAEVVGLEHREHDGDLLCFSVQRYLPGRSLAESIDDLDAGDLQRLVIEAGEILARVHSVIIDDGRGIAHELRDPDGHQITRIGRFVAEHVDPAAVMIIERGADFLRRQVASGPTARPALAQGDFLPKNLLVHEAKIVGVLDWEFAGPASPAFDLARWVVSAGDPLHERSDLLHRGYGRITDPESAAAGLIDAYAIDWALEMLGWRYPASPEQIRRCVAVIDRYAD